MVAPQYIVLEISHDGKYTTTKYDSSENLKTYLHSYLDKHNCVYLGNTIEEYDQQYLQGMLLYQLIDFAVRVGEIVLNKKVGFGIVNIIEITGCTSVIHGKSF